MALRLFETVTCRPWWVVGTVLIAVLAAASGMRHLEFSNNYRVFFSPKNPDLLAFEKFQDTYTKNDNILFGLQPADGDLFTPRLTDSMEELAAAAWKIPYAIRVDSITNFQRTWADGDELTVEDLVRGGAALGHAELERRRAVALAEPLLRGNLISPDAATTGINVTLQYPKESLAEVPTAVGHARELVRRFEEEHPGVRVALSGLSIMNSASCKVTALPLYGSPGISDGAA